MKRIALIILSTYFTNLTAHCSFLRLHGFSKTMHVQFDLVFLLISDATVKHSKKYFFERTFFLHATKVVSRKKGGKGRKTFLPASCETQDLISVWIDMLETAVSGSRHKAKRLPTTLSGC